MDKRQIRHTRPGSIRTAADIFICLLLWFAVGPVKTFAQEVLPAGNAGNLQFNPAPALSIAGDYRHFELDRLGNLFLIGAQGNQITEFNKKGDSVNHYDNVRSYGQITELDVTNPLKIAVYYRDFGTIVVLDRYLSPVNTIDLRKTGIWDAQSIATSYDNQYWIYDKQEAKIKKVDGQGKISFASSDLRQVFDEGVDPVKLLDRDGLLYSYDPAYGWYIFDYYGALKQKVPVEGLENLAAGSAVLSGRKDTALWLMKNVQQIDATPVWKDIAELGVSVRQTLFDGATGRLWVLTAQGIQSYRLQQAQ